MLLDERGRLFGKWNIIDAAVVVFLVVCLALAYGAYGMFQPPLPLPTAFEPSTLTPDVTSVVIVRGQHLTPYLTVKVGTVLSQWLIRDPYTAEIHIPPLPSGVYPVKLYDAANLLVTVPGALTVTRAPLDAKPLIQPLPRGAAVLWQSALSDDSQIRMLQLTGFKTGPPRCYLWFDGPTGMAFDSLESCSLAPSTHLEPKMP